MKKYKNRIKVPRFNEENGFYTTTARSKLMSKIRSRDTKPEVIFRKAFWKKGFRYRTNDSKLPGKPDIIFPAYKVIVFIDGEFWHGYNWKEKRERIKSNRDFWIPKIERNMERDNEVNKLLEDKGYQIFRFWENEIKNDFENCFIIVFNCLQERKLKNR